MGAQHFEILVFLPRGPPEIDHRLLDQIQGPEIYSRRPGRRGTSVFSLLNLIILHLTHAACMGVF